MSILIGGAGSSGSTLLRTQLNKHAKIFSGPELSLFNKSMFYTDWDNAKELLKNRRKIATDGWFPYPSVNVDNAAYGWQVKELEAVIDHSRNLSEFSSIFFERAMKEKGADIWIEKTPSNSYCFDMFLAASEKNKVIHIVRDPYDSVTSLVKRGMSHYFAAGLWVYNNSCSLTVKNDNRYMRLKYEDLVVYPRECLSKIFNFIGVPDQAPDYGTMKEVRKSQSDKIAAWNHDPNDKIVYDDRRGYKAENADLQQRICYALASFRISKYSAKAKKLAYLACEDLCEELGYSYHEPQKAYPFNMTLQMSKDIIYRSSRMYPSRPPAYPGALKY